MTQHKEEDREDEEGTPEIRIGGGNDEDSAPLSEAKGESLTEEAYDEVEEKEKKREEGKCLFE
eukprot:11604618-Ditylum_brightwellii.AAC.1